jgi:hypothetical protein
LKHLPQAGSVARSQWFYVGFFAILIFGGILGVGGDWACHLHFCRESSFVLKQVNLMAVCFCSCKSVWYSWGSSGLSSERLSCCLCC